MFLEQFRLEALLDYSPDSAFSALWKLCSSVLCDCIGTITGVKFIESFNIPVAFFYNTN